MYIILSLLISSNKHNFFNLLSVSLHLSIFLAILKSLSTVDSKGKVTAYKSSEIYFKVVCTKGVDKLCIADLTHFMIKGSFDFTILL